MGSGVLSDRTKSLLEVETSYTAGGYDPMPVFVSRAKGVNLWDEDGKEYLDFTCMFGAVNQGHSHPKIVSAVTAQMEKASLVNCAAHSAIWPPFARMMCRRFGYDKVVSTMSGTEAVESACKIARKWGIKVKGIPPKKLLILATSGCYHGLSVTMWGFQDHSPQKDGKHCSGQLRSPVNTDSMIAYGIEDAHCINHDPETEEALTYGDIDRMRACIKHHHGRIAAVIVECIRGHLRTKEDEIQYCEQLFDLCKEYNILFISDEVRMGCGKTGRFLSSDWLGKGRKPDMVTLGKSIAGGVYPASFVLGRAQCMDLVGTKEIISTFQFSPVAISATAAALCVIDEEFLVERAGDIERLVMRESLTWKHSFVSHVTARGADFGVWLCGVGQNVCRHICEMCMNRGLLVFPSHLRIRMGVAMVMTDAELLKGLGILRSVFDAMQVELDQGRGLAQV
ncbi:unnamed protein product [Clonostachys rhizophaga]|uniref:Ornithine aminotransferase n=1 Tax=Clonostachys rhizophaga TaxID=160324 RepID=A0A9N9YQU1_9HYPO|nr:unnamed protein product [Clonostachys rhizophaga]